MSRKYIPKKTKETLLNHYSYMCAICDTSNPEVHHIDGNNENNNLENLIPLCSNCHSDIHRKNKKDPNMVEKLKLFRIYNKKEILSPKFDPLFEKLKFVLEVNLNNRDGYLFDACENLIGFVNHMEKGSFYKKELLKFLDAPLIGIIPFDDKSDQILEERRIEYINQLIGNKDKILSLIIESLVYQNWSF